MSSNPFEEELDISLHKSKTNYGTFKRESLNIGRNLNESNNKQYRKFHKSEIWGNRIKAKNPDLESDR